MSVVARLELAGQHGADAESLKDFLQLQPRRAEEGPARGADVAQLEPSRTTWSRR